MRSCRFDILLLSPLQPDIFERTIDAESDVLLVLASDGLWDEV